jgi:hypothetical protein
MQMSRSIGYAFPHSLQVFMIGHPPIQCIALPLRGTMVSG